MRPIVWWPGKIGSPPFFSTRPARVPELYGPDDAYETAEKMSEKRPRTTGIDISKATLDVHALPAGLAP
jgi:hypothetical protein